MKYIVILLLSLIAGIIDGKNYYDVLGIKSNVPQEQIAEVCKKDIKLEKQLQKAIQEAANARKSLKESGQKGRSRKLDELEGNVREIRLKQILREDACDTLSNPKERQKYDALSPAEQEQKITEQEELQHEAATDDKGIALDSIEKKRLFIQQHIDRGGKFNVTRIIGDFFKYLNLPQAARALFSEDAEMQDARFVPGPKGLDFRESLGFTGTLEIKEERLQSTIYIVQDNNFKLKYSWKTEFPHGKTIKDIFPQLKELEIIKLPEPALIVSNFSYLDRDLVSLSIAEGITLVAKLSLDGPLQVLKELIDKAAKTEAIIVRSEPIIFYGSIPKDVVSATFGSVVPLRLGIDFTKIPKLPKEFTKVFKELTTDDFKFSMKLKPEVKLTIAAGIRLVLGTQKDPLKFIGIGEITPGHITLGRSIRGLDLGIIEINNVTTTVDIDRELVKLTILIGCPITGVGVLGIISVGENDQAVFSVGGGLSFKSDGAPTFVLDLKAQNVKFADVVALLFKMAEKAGIKGVPPVDKIPSMTIERARGYVALADTEIAGKKYSAGFALQFEAELFDKRFGFNIDIQHLNLKANGFGYLPPIDIKANGRTVFLLSGPGIDTAGFKAEDRGPAVKCTFEVKNPLKSKFQVGAVLEVPDIGLRQVVKFILSKRKFKADFETEFPGFTTEFYANLDPIRPDKFKISFKFKNDINDAIKKHLDEAFDKLKKETEEKAAEADRKIAGASTSIKGAQKEGVQKVRNEIIRAQNQIKGSIKKIKKLQNDCGTVSFANIPKKIAVCAKAGAGIAKEGINLARYETYLNTALKAGEDVIKGTTGVAALTTKEIGEAQILKKTSLALVKGLEGLAGLPNLVVIKEAEGSFDTQDVIHARSPKLAKFVAEVNLPNGVKKEVRLENLQFDFKEPAKALGKIAEDLAKDIVKGITK